MKRILFAVLVVAVVGTVFLNVFALGNRETVEYDDVNTLNFVAKFGHMELSSIEKICSYDYCEMRTGSTFKEVINNFTKNYLKTIRDEEVKATLRVKGIKITEVMFTK